MIDVLFFGVGLLAVATGIWRAVRARRTGAGSGLAISLIALGIALCLLADSAQAIESQLYPSLGRLLSNLATMVAAYGIEVTVAEIGGVAERRRRARLGVLIVALVVLTASFFATRGLPTGVGLFDALYRSNPTLVVYIVVYTLYLGFAVADIAVVSAGAVRAGTGALRAGLGIMLLACVFAFAYLVGKIVDLISGLTAEHPAPKLCRGAFSTVRCTLAVGFPALSVLLIVVGLTVPALPALGRAVRDARTRAALRPLREHLASRYPDIVRLDDASGTGRERLLTMMSEINDGLLLSGVGPDASPTAAAQVVRSSGPVPDEPAEPPVLPQETAFAAEVARLRAIAQAFRAEPTAGAANPAP
ncbi:hypothetical protein CU254_22105 [Amycolatopsis sp. AA4]|uniref:MAB_1171c family putative transporter n=1 Tax=Actinomycetes TaxID=1760 RepID=UPI0001B58082|nr:MULTISPECIES: MAB_1171c family putative transporter [Actinomycetes]ATY12844.1 hypothetical protein CU254_22105 [Amycolatopsis sp. AA4]EFL08677.1 predicted protein [Streptomyces sp. AA4]